VLARSSATTGSPTPPYWQAQSALNSSPAARVYDDEQRECGLDHDATLRALSNRLVGILHACLKARTLYDEATSNHTA